MGRRRSTQCSLGYRRSRVLPEKNTLRRRNLAHSLDEMQGPKTGAARVIITSGVPHGRFLAVSRMTEAVSQAYGSDVSVTLDEGHTGKAGFGGFLRSFVFAGRR